jgi:hypothetical protein
MRPDVEIVARRVGRSHARLRRRSPNRAERSETRAEPRSSRQVGHLAHDERVTSVSVGVTFVGECDEVATSGVVPASFRLTFLTPERRCSAPTASVRHRAFSNLSKFRGVARVRHRHDDRIDRNGVFHRTARDASARRGALDVSRAIGYEYFNGAGATLNEMVKFAVPEQLSFPNET